MSDNGHASTAKVLYKAPYKIGITGSIGSGKSTVGKVLAEQGVAVLDTDHVVHDLLANDAALIQQLTERFGSELLNDTGQINRKALGALVFNQPSERQWLESLIHPLVRQETLNFLTSTEGASLRAVLVPLLFEAGSADLYDETWAIVVDDIIQWQRLKERESNHWDETQMQQRIQAQWPQSKKAAHATWVIDNSHSLEATKKLVLERLKAIHSLQGEPV